MVVCKFFQQGDCRFGQYCRFEHVNNSFGNNTAIRPKTYIDGKNIALIVAEDVLAAERGGQWILSCFAPFKDQCIPGMEDVSPEEVRWNMYQAQKDGTSDQVRLQFQQMCQDMKRIHEALKNPTQETVLLLEKLQKPGPEKPTYPFGVGATPLNSTTSSGTQANNVFGGGNSYGGNYTANTGSSVFGNSDVFGAKPAFGGGSLFGSSTGSATSSLFGGNTKIAPSAFGSAQNQTYGGNSIFGGSTPQPAFGQPPAFGATSQANNIFTRPPQTSQPSNVFGTVSTTTGSSIFANSASSGGSLFGGANQTTVSAPFGSNTNTSVATTTSMFGQPTTTAAFGKAPVFGNLAGGFNAASTGTQQVFGAQSTFGESSATAVAPNNVFLRPGTSNFGAAISSTNSTFGTTNVTAQNVSAPFGAVTSTTAAPFSTFNAQQAPFVATSNAPNYGDVAVAAFTAPFATTSTTPSAATMPASAPSFLNISKDSGRVFSNMFANSNSAANSAVTNTVASNPFMQQPNDGLNAPFGSNPFTSNANAFGVITVTATIDDTMYSADGCLTDDEKNMYLSEQFILSKIPLKPPTQDLR